MELNVVFKEPEHKTEPEKVTLHIEEADHVEYNSMVSTTQGNVIHHFTNYENLMKWQGFSLEDINDAMLTVGIDQEAREAVMTSLLSPDRDAQEFLDFIRSREGTE